MLVKTVLCLACFFGGSSAIVGPLLGLSSDPNDLKFYYFPTANAPAEIVYNDAASFANSNFKSGVPTVLVIDGFLSNLTSPMSVAIKDGLSAAKGNNINLIVVDWGKLSGSSVLGIFLISNIATLTYPFVIPNVPIVAERIADFLDFIDVDLTKTHIIGHSLGAQIAGQAGAFTISKFLTPLMRISGLDPAGPFYQTVDLPRNQRISALDASFVDAYHTCRGELGTLDTNSGDIDVCVNGGGGPLLSQPGCALTDNNPGVPGLTALTGYCSHSYSWRFFNATLFNRIEACPCDVTSLSCFCRTNCGTTCESPLVVGENISYSARGNYSLTIADTFK